MSESDQGFTLIEALVAMAVLAVASTGLIQATERHVDLIRGGENRAVAGWVAENRLVELGLPGLQTQATVEMLGRDWSVATATSPGNDPELATVDVSVSIAGEPRPLATLRGFRDIGVAGRDIGVAGRDIGVAR